MPETFLHGVEIVEVDTGTRTITTVRSGVIGIVGTAPEADATAFPLNTPVLIAGSRTEAAKLGASGTLPGALEGIFDQVGAVVIVVRVEQGETNLITLANVIGGVNAVDGSYEGVHALVGAESAVGFAPRILIAPGWTHQRIGEVAGDDVVFGNGEIIIGGVPAGSGETMANPVVSELIGIAEQLRAVIISDGPNTTDADAISYAGDFGSDRVYLVDPWVKVFSSEGTVVTEPASARVAGIIAKSDNERGFWWSPSNRAINGIIGVGRPISFRLGDANSRANLLNEQKVATIVYEDGYRLWGNRSLSTDSKWQFLMTRRIADILNDSLQRAHLWAVDRNITKTYLKDVSEGVNEYIRSLVNQGALLGGNCWPDPDLNTAANIANGKVFFNFDFTPPYPAEHITFNSILTTDYIEEALS